MKNLKNNSYNDCLRYINTYWKKITFSHPRDQGIHLGLPNKFVAPNNEIYRKDQFYWDTYFVILGLVTDKSKIGLAKGMVENFLFMFKRFNIMPMRNRYYNIGISQIPFLTSMAFEIYEVDQDKRWLHKVIKVAEAELDKYWMNEKLTEKHIIYRGLSRYCDHYITHLGAEHESGWDMTSRFHDRCLDYLPVDLNTCLFKYEMDIARAYTILKNPQKVKQYEKRALDRKKVMTELMWNEKMKFFFDYNKNRKQQNHFYSVAGFYPLWARLATQEQAAQIRMHVLPMLEFEGGVANTQSENLSPDLKQHDHPNGWPHQQYIVVKGLLNYGFREDAERIARKWTDMNMKLFYETGKFWEKYNVVNRGIGVFNPDRYPTQSGFGWTNAIFLRLVNELNLEDEKQGPSQKNTAKLPSKKKAAKKSAKKSGLISRA